MTPTILSLFTGAGGLDHGFAAAGFRHGVAVEMDHACCETLRASRPDWQVIERDVHRVTTRTMLLTADAEADGDTMLIGGPPCQPFSKSGWWSSGATGRMDDPRASTLLAYMRVLEEARPRAFLLENVEGLAYRGKSEGLDFVLARIQSINERFGTRYRPVVTHVNAADYGVPQMRARLLIVGIRDGTVFDPPHPTHGPGREPYHTAWDALGDLEWGNEDLRMRGKWADLLPSIPEGQNYLWHTSRMGGTPIFGWRRRYWSFLLKLAKDKPSWTIQAQPGPATGPFHWDNRQLSTRELARLQTFPDDIIIPAGRRAAVAQLGNAVPSLLAEVFARRIAEQAFGLVPLGTKPQLMPSRRHPVPPPEKVAPVPQRFLAMAGHHAPHPGTGLGYGSQKQRVGEAP